MAAESSPELIAEMQEAIAHVPCPVGICLQDVGNACLDRPEEAPAHRPRVADYRVWLAGQGG